MTYVYVWEYAVAPAHTADFERCYGPEGDWVRLFRRANGHVVTELHRDDADPRRFVTLDQWSSRAAWDAFRADFASEFEAIDARGEGWTIEEREIARFEGAALARAATPTSRRLAVYGTLAPGAPNHERMKAYGGTWSSGTVQGRLHEAGWGAALGSPAMTLESGAEPVAVHVLEAEALETAWSALDAFEGEEYVRVVAPVETAAGIELANVYVLRG